MIRFASISKLSGLPNSPHTPGLCPRSMAARIFCEFRFCLTDQIAGGHNSESSFLHWGIYDCCVQAYENHCHRRRDAYVTSTMSPMPRSGKVPGSGRGATSLTSIGTS